MPTFRALITELAKELGDYYSGTLSAGTTSLLTDTTTDSPWYSSRNTISDSHFDDSYWIKITSGSADGEVRRVHTSDVSAGTITPESNFSATPSTASYELCSFDRPDILGIGRYINLALRDMKYPTRYWATLVSDGDMDASGTTSWSTTSSASVGKTTAAANVWSGQRALTVTPSGAGGYVQSASVLCGADDEFYVEASALPNTAAQDARLVVWDVTNGAAVKTFSDWTEGRWGILGGETVSAPSGCNAIAFRLTAVNNTIPVHWDNVTCLRIGQEIYDLPSTFDMAQNVWVDKWATPGSTNLPEDRPYYRAREWNLLHSATAANPYRVRVSSDATGAGPITVRYKRRFDELSAETDTTPLPVEYVLTAAKVHAYELRARNADNDAEREYWAGQARIARASYQALSPLYSPNVPEPVMSR